MEYIIRLSMALYAIRVSRKIRFNSRLAPTEYPLPWPTFSHEVIRDGAQEKSWKSRILDHTCSPDQEQ
jgi:hypothetical protein